MQDITNADRAGWALAALAGFIDDTRVDNARDAVADLIVNLLHLARGRGLDIGLLLAQAARATAEEQADDEEGEMASVISRFREMLPEDR